MLKAVIFDMDGVISDSERLYVDVKNEALASLGIYDVPYEYHMQFIGTTHEYQWKVMSRDFHAEHISTEEYLEVLYATKDRIFREAGIAPIRGVLEFIDHVKKAGYPIAVASSSTIEEIREMLDSFGITQWFDALVSGWEVAHGKPAPDIFFEAARRMKMRPENCMVIEDSPNGAIGAKKAGMFCLGFSNMDFPMSDMKEADAVFKQYEDISVEYCKELME